jgi:hypothetical protein
VTGLGSTDTTPGILEMVTRTNMDVSLQTHPGTFSTTVRMFGFDEVIFPPETDSRTGLAYSAHPDTQRTKARHIAVTTKVPLVFIVSSFELPSYDFDS